MTTNLFVIANVKQLRTGGSFRILLPFFRASCGVGVRNSAIFNSFHSRVEFGTILEGLPNFGGGGWLNPSNPPTSVRHWVLVVRPEGKRPLERPSRRWDGNSQCIGEAQTGLIWLRTGISCGRLRMW